MQDRTFNRNPASANFGQLIYPAKWVPEYFGQAMIVNGKAWPYQNVQPRKYRYRVWNGCNDRVLDFQFSNGMTFWQIGTDGGLLEHPAPLTHLVISPGERADLVVDFSKAKGQRLVLTNSATTPYPYGDAVNESTTAKIMQFRVSKNAVTDPSSLPQDLSNDIPSAASLVAQASQTRDITLSEVPDPTHPDPSSPGDYLPMPLLEAKLFGAPVDVTPTLGSTEVWRYINLTGDTHPIHQHDVMNRIVDRIPFNFGAYAYDKANNQLKPLEDYYLGPPIPPAANEDGWKDTVQCPPGFVTEIALTFTDFTGSYVFHCHILSHEEHDMMRPFQVLPAP